MPAYQLYIFHVISTEAHKIHHVNVALLLSYDTLLFIFPFIRPIATYTMKAPLKSQTQQTHKLTPLVHIIL